MKKLLFILIPLIYSCNNISDDNLIKEIVLANDVGIVKIDLIAEFDTYNESYGQSNCGCCCANLIYSFKDKNNDNLQSLDTIPYLSRIENSDSLKIFSFSIYHTACIDCNSNGFKINEEYLELQENMLLQENTKTMIKLKEIIMINGQLFSVIGNSSKYSNYVIENIEATTIFKGETITFFGQRKNKQESEFIEDIFRMIKSIELN